jgi:hypothetical protein
MKSTIAFTTLALAVLLLGLSGAEADEPPPLFRGARGPALAMSSADAAVRAARPVEVDLDALAGPSTRLPLAAGRAAGTLTAVWDRVERTSARRHAWIGRVHGVTPSEVTLVADPDRGIVVGSVAVPGALFRIRYAGQGVHVVEEVDPRSFPDDIVIPVRPPLADAAPPAVGADDGSIVDLLVVYTPAARAAAGGTAGMEAIVDLAVLETNSSYANSGVHHRLRLVHAQEIPYTEASIETDLTRLAGTADGYMDEVHGLRDAHGADLVALLREGTEAACGVAYLMTTPSSAFAPWAFSVTARDCATGYYSFAHEIGHNLGADHDWAMTPNGAAASFNHGYVSTTLGWRTVMAYGESCGYCTRLPRWSNPDLFHNGERTGVAEGSFRAADNRKTLNNAALTVANFRPAVSDPGTACDPAAAPGCVLANRVAVGPLDGTAGDRRFYYIDVPRGRSSLTVRTRGGSGDVTLFLHLGEVPTATRYTCRSRRAGTGEVCTIENPTPGRWFVLLRTGTSYEGVSLEARMRKACARGTAPGCPLANGAAVSVSGPQDSLRYFYMDVPAGRPSLTVDMWGGAGDADLYVRLGDVPTMATYHCRPYLTGNAESCTFTAPPAGRWFIMLHGFGAYTGVSVRATH